MSVNLTSDKTQQGPSGTMVPRLDMCRSTISLCKITHQKWCDHPFSQRNKTTKRAVGMKVGGVGLGLDRNWKRRIGNIRGLHKITELGTLCQLWSLPLYHSYFNFILFVHTGHANFDFYWHSVFTECCF